MKPYMIIEGVVHEICIFEKKVAEALELGYSLAGELIVKSQATETELYQPMLLIEDLEEDEEFYDEEELSSNS